VTVAVAVLPAQMAGPALTVANGNGFTVTAAVLLRALLHAGKPEVIAILVSVTLKVPADAVDAEDEAAVVSVTAPSPVPVIVLPVVVPSV
jgi:hypothetical protein